MRWLGDVAWLEVFRAVTALLVGIAWPLAVVTLGLIFRHEIKNKFKDIEKAGPDGFTFRAQQNSTAISEIESTELALLPSPDRTQLQERLEQNILRDLANIKDETRIQLLTQQLAVAKISRLFELIFADIFGSQIRALVEIDKRGGKVPLDETRRFFDHIKEEFQEFYKDASFQAWFRFFEMNNLLKVDGANVVFAELGPDFILFLRAQKAGISKSF